MRPGAALLPFDSHVTSHISRFTSSDEGGKKKAPEGETESERNRFSSQGQPAATVNEPLQPMSQQSTESLPSIHLSCIIQPTITCPTKTQSYNNPYESNRKLLTESYKMSSKTFLLLIFYSVFFLPLHHVSGPRDTLWCCLFVFTPCRQTRSFIKGAMERTVCHEGPSSTVPHCFRGWMSHRRRIRVGGI